MESKWLDLLVAVAALALGASPFLLAILSTLREAQSLLRAGAYGEAEILGYGADEVCPWVEYQFTPCGNLEPLVCIRLLPLGGERFGAGAKVPVRYRADLPSVSVLVPHARTQSV